MERGSVRCLLDTAPWINGVTMPQVLPERIRRLGETPEPKGLCSGMFNLTLITADPVLREAKLCSVEYYPFRPARAHR